MSLENKWIDDNDDDDNNDDDDDDCNTNFKKLLISLFTSDVIMKLGFGLSGDFNRLSVSFPNNIQYNFKNLKNHFDFSILPEVIIILILVLILILILITSVWK